MGGETWESGWTGFGGWLGLVDLCGQTARLCPHQVVPTLGVLVTVE